MESLDLNTWLPNEALACRARNLGLNSKAENTFSLSKLPRRKCQNSKHDQWNDWREYIVKVFISTESGWTQMTQEIKGTDKKKIEKKNCAILGYKKWEAMD